jgi:hypothetical protein
MVILLFAAEIEILNEQDAPGREKVFVEAAEAYRARAATYQAMIRSKPARVDLARAALLETKAAKLRRTPPRGRGRARRTSAESEKREEAPSASAGRIRIVNAWKEPVSVVVDGKSYYLLAGEEKMINRAAGEFTYEVQMLNHWAKAQVAAGQTYTIRIRPR